MPFIYRVGYASHVWNSAKKEIKTNDAALLNILLSKTDCILTYPPYIMNLIKCMYSEFFFFAGLPFVFGQNYGPPVSSSSAASSSTTISSSGSVQTVTVAKGGGLNFTPDTLIVAPGSQVVFQFDSMAHSVTQSSFDQPCQPISPAGINSGFSTITSGPNVCKQSKYNSSLTPE